ncbi:peptide deformylase [Bifidobacterium magnum]|uniref:Polypeptide deformylase n=1 Tax=Bifidobacterium magnum TaxID=1692 RepID=A0A087BBM4_9BIFI|nr:peptide deformylase [Bifidobacterium magnum]KFI68424.1 Polypeptide deformylase [Bifidobacterium magnum]
MERTIVTALAELGKPSAPADPTNEQDRQIATDLVDTLQAHRAECVGMGANMIGERKRVIVFVDEDLGGKATVMFNPVITDAEGAYETEEGCLSLDGERPTKRFDRIEVEYDNRRGRHCHARFSGWTAQIIQHEIDHCNGVII